MMMTKMMLMTMLLLLLLICCCWFRFDGLSGAMPDGTPRMEVPAEIEDSIRKNKVRAAGASGAAAAVEAVVPA